MAKKLIVKEEAKVEQPPVHSIHPITQEFGNGDLNILRDKINEIIKHQ